jgi:hypothetical protein
MHAKPRHHDTSHVLMAIQALRLDQRSVAQRKGVYQSLKHSPGRWESL